MRMCKTNINGAENVIDAALESGVKHVVALSTDKAVRLLIYMVQQITSDKLFIAANNIKGTRDIRIFCSSLWKCNGF